MRATRPPPPPQSVAGFKPEQLELARRVRPFAEAMYLVLAVDADLGERERDILRGTLRALTDDLVSSAVLERMLLEFETARSQEGLELRLDAVAARLYGDPTDAELALELAIAGAEVDGRFSAREQSIVQALAERLGISPGHVAELLDETARGTGPTVQPRGPSDT